MRSLFLLLLVIITIAGCTIGGTEIDCDDIEDGAACTCEDGSKGVVRCTQAFIDCVCDESESGGNSAPTDAGHDDVDADDDGDDADVADTDTGETQDATDSDSGDDGG